MNGRTVGGTAVDRRRLLTLSALVVPALVLPAACSRGSAADDGTARVIPVADRRAAPPLSGRTLTGTALSVAAWAGSPVVVNIWGSWCPPCRDEAPALTEAARQLMAKGVRFVGLDIDESGGTAAALAYYETYGVNYPSLVDDDKSLQLGFAGIVPVSAPPSTIVLDARHRVAAAVTGSIGTASALVELVDDATVGPA